MSLTKTVEQKGPTTILNQRIVRRIVVALIQSAQVDLKQRGLIREDQTLITGIESQDDAALDATKIDENTLGFDSLTRLELINDINQFFQLSQSGAEDYLLIAPTIGGWCDVIHKHFQLVGDAQRFGFVSSGSAGTPTVHIHNLLDLIAEIEAQLAGPLKEFDASRRIITLVPPQHIYGFLFSCLLPSLRGIEVIDLHSKAPSAAARAAKAGDLIVGTPFSWEMVFKAGLPIADDVYGLTSAGPSTATLWERGSVYPDKMVEVYGSTETAGIGWRSAWGAPFELLSHLERAGEDVARAGASDRTLPIQDVLRWQGSGHFELDGRIDHVVQIAGVNVSPSHVASVIADVGNIADVSVRLGRERLKCFIVPCNDRTKTEALEIAIRARLMRDLPAPARPSSLTFGPALPRNKLGKLCDWPEPAVGETLDC